MKKYIIMMGLLFMAVTTKAQVISQTINLVAGWNAFYLHVDPGTTANAFFAAWPVDDVSLYDSASFLRTAQYSTDVSTEPTLSAAYLVWHRDLDDVSTLKNMAGDRIYVCFASAPYVSTVYGTPCVQRMAWRQATVGLSETSLNFFGVSMSEGTSISTADYLKGLTNGYTSVQRITGGNPAKMGLLDAGTVKDGAVLVMDSTKIDDWAGPLYLSPLGGVNFGEEFSMADFSIRNDASSNRTVSIAYRRSQGPNVVLEPPLLKMLYKTSSNTWESVPSVMTKTLDAGETWALVLAIDRAQFSGVAGAKRAGLLTVSDMDGGSYFRARVPVSAISAEIDPLEKAAWPAGLWLADLKMNQVSQVISYTNIISVASGGTMALRAILHVDSNGDMMLLQRVLIATSIDGDGAAHVALHLSDAAIPSGASVMRLSTVDMGVDNLQVAHDSGTFRQQAEFSFVVAAGDRSNPFRHAYHPDHDGLRWDFTTSAPAGDNPTNYVGTVKPETFSVSNVLSFAWSGDAADIAVWDSSEKLRGTCRWSLTGLRREVTIHADGSFTMQRISTVGALTP